MRYDVLTNMKTKTDKAAADVLLYLQKCRDAIKNIPAPEGIDVLLTVESRGKRAQNIGLLAQEMGEKMRRQLEAADNSATRSQRKALSCVNTLLKSARSSSRSTPKKTKKQSTKPGAR